MSVLMNTIVFEDCRNQWSVSRPLLGLILLNEKVSAVAGGSAGGDHWEEGAAIHQAKLRQRQGSQPSLSWDLEHAGQGCIPPEGPSPEASDLLQLLSRGLTVAFLASGALHWTGGLLSSASSAPSLPSLFQEIVGNNAFCPFLGLPSFVGSQLPSVVAVAPQGSTLHPEHKSPVLKCTHHSGLPPKFSSFPLNPPLSPQQSVGTVHYCLGEWIVYTIREYWGKRQWD